MSKNTHHAHDKIFKAAFQMKETAEEFIKEFLPPEIVKLINFDNFDLDITDYISGDMKELFADIVYSAQLNDKRLKIAFLFEHKSNIEPNIRAQLLDYINAIRKQDIQAGRPFTFVLPIVIYQGKKKWRKKPAYQDFKHLPHILRSFVPEFDFFLIEVNEIDGKKILSLSDDSLLKSLFAAYKYAKDETFLRENLNSILEFYTKKPELFAYLQQILIYLFSQSTLKNSIMTDILTHISSPIKNTAMTTYAQIIEEGKREGRKEGKREEKRERDQKLVIQLYRIGTPVAAIIDLMEVLTATEVKNILKEINN